MERTPRDDPFIRPPGIPEKWRLVRSLVQALAGLTLVIGPVVSPTMLFNEFVDGPWPEWSMVAILGFTVAVAAAALVIQRRVSRVAGTLLAVGALIQFLGWLFVLSVELSERDH